MLILTQNICFVVVLIYLSRFIFDRYVAHECVGCWHFLFITWLFNSHIPKVSCHSEGLIWSLETEKLEEGTGRNKFVRRHRGILTFAWSKWWCFWGWSGQREDQQHKWSLNKSFCKNTPFPETTVSFGWEARSLLSAVTSSAACYTFLWPTTVGSGSFQL